MENAWIILYGLAKILEGLVIIFTLGFVLPKWSFNVSLALARWRMKKDQKIT